VHPAREVNRAHVLMALDQGVPEAALWRTRAACRQGGLAFALHDEPRSGRPRKYQTGLEAEDRMHALLGLYAGPYNAQEPVVCVDEKSRQLLRQTRAPITLEPGRCAHADYEYRRAGTRNLIVAVEPGGKRRFTARPNMPVG
jgi:hypothetical protein